MTAGEFAWIWAIAFVSGAGFGATTVLEIINYRNKR